MTVTWDMADRFVDSVSRICDENCFAGVYGLPRGGLPLAVWISHRAGIPLLLAPCRNALVVDDIADTGATLDLPIHPFYSLLLPPKLYARFFDDVHIA